MSICGNGPLYFPLDIKVNVIHFMNMVHALIQPLSRRERKRSARIEGIVDAAMRVATEEGLAQVTTHRLAKELDLAVGALYRYFPSKDAIIEAMQKRALEDYGDILRDAMKSVRGWVVTQEVPAPELVEILAIGLRYQRLVKSHPQHFHLNNQVMGNPDNVLPGQEGDRVVAVMMRLFEDLSSPVARAQEAGLINADVDPLDRVILFWSSLRAILGVSKLEAHDAVIRGESLFVEMMLTMLRGFGADSEALSSALESARRWTTSEER